MEYRERFYRDWVKSDLKKFRVSIEESDLFILCDKDLSQEAHTELFKLRKELEMYIQRDYLFKVTLVPHILKSDPPLIAKIMNDAATMYKVGPMAAVAGAFSQLIGEHLLNLGAKTVIVENGGDIFVKSSEPVSLGLYAGETSPFKDKIKFEVSAVNGLGICTSSYSVGPSFSFGIADAVAIISDSAAIADAAASYLGNRIKTKEDIEGVLNYEIDKKILKGIIICCEDKLGVYGDIKLL